MKVQKDDIVDCLKVKRELILPSCGERKEAPEGALFYDSNLQTLLLKTKTGWRRFQIIEEYNFVSNYYYTFSEKDCLIVVLNDINLEKSLESINAASAEAKASGKKKLKLKLDRIPDAVRVELLSFFPTNKYNEKTKEAVIEI